MTDPLSPREVEKLHAILEEFGDPETVREKLIAFEEIYRVRNELLAVAKARRLRNEFAGFIKRFGGWAVFFAGVAIAYKELSGSAKHLMSSIWSGK